MYHSDAARLALMAATAAHDIDSRDVRELMQGDLYAFARKHKFPPAETLARQMHEWLAPADEPFPVEKWATTETWRATLDIWRAVVVALQPYATEGEERPVPPEPEPKTADPSMPPATEAEQNDPGETDAATEGSEDDAAKAKKNAGGKK